MKPVNSEQWEFVGAHGMRPGQTRFAQTGVMVDY
jgi:hypothetical protein